MNTLRPAPVLREPADTASMRDRVWIGLVLIGVVVEVVMFFVLGGMSASENCDNGIARWECNDSLGNALAVGIFVWPVIVAVCLFLLRPRSTSASDR